MDAIYRSWAEVDLNALRGNLAWLRHRVGTGVKIITVVKADAYGHGLRQIAALLMQSGTDVFGVANLVEARHVREVGAGWPILMLGSCLPQETELAVKDGVMPTISSLEEAHRFALAARKIKRTVDVHLKVDTGMGRLGIAPGNALELATRITRMAGLRLVGLMTHFCAAEDDLEFSERQRDVFGDVLRTLETAGITIPWIHAANSGALLHEPETIFTVVRPGLLVYGILPPGNRRVSSVLQKHLSPALAWKSRVSLVKTVLPGATISYGHTFTAPKKMRVATVSAGYGDGYMRAGSNRAEVLVGGKRCRVLGRVTMDQMVVDASHLPKIASGDEVVLIGQQGREVITATELAHWTGSIPWEVLTNISYRVPRIYRGGYAA